MKQLILNLLVILSVGKLCAQEKNITVAELKDIMVSKTENVKTISCDFVQHKHMQYLDATITSKGKLFFDKRNRLRWEYKEPFEYQITINNGKFFINTDGQTSEYDIESNKMFSQISELIISSVNGTIFTDSKFNVVASETKTHYHVMLQPNIPELKEVISKMKMLIDKKDFSVDKVVMYEQQDDFTEINFINKKFNAELPDHLFSVE